MVACFGMFGVFPLHLVFLHKGFTYDLSHFSKHEKLSPFIFSGPLIPSRLYSLFSFGKPSKHVLCARPVGHVLLRFLFKHSCQKGAHFLPIAGRRDLPIPGIQFAPRSRSHAGTAGAWGQEKAAARRRERERKRRGVPFPVVSCRELKATAAALAVAVVALLFIYLKTNNVLCSFRLLTNSGTCCRFLATHAFCVLFPSVIPFIHVIRCPYSREPCWDMKLARNT